MYIYIFTIKIFFVSLPSKKFIQVFADYILCPCLPRCLQLQNHVGTVFLNFFAFTFFSILPIF